MSAPSAMRIPLGRWALDLYEAGPTVTFPLQIFGATRVRIPLQIHVLATTIVLVGVGLLFLGTVLGNRRQPSNDGG